MRTAIRKHLGDFLAIVGLFVLAIGIGGYILANQRLRFPVIEEKPFTVKAELQNAQAVQPGQGQTVRTAGVEIGQIGKVELEDGVAVVEMQLERKYKGFIRQDATALLRPKTGVKDMFIEVDPGDGKPLGEDDRITVGNTLQDVDPDEVLSALDADTRDYLRLLITGAGKGLKGRGSDLRETFARLGPLHRDLARVTKSIARRRNNLRRLIHNYSLLVDELGKNGEDLTRLVRTSNDVLSAFASEDQNISRFVALLPGTLRQTESTLVKVDRLGQRLGPAMNALRPPFRQLAVANRQSLPFLREATPIVRNQIRPFTREARPFFAELGAASRDLSRAGPDIRKTLKGLNRFFNIGAYNPRGAEPLTGNIQRDRDRIEGYLWWLGWTGQNTVSLFNTSDAQGPWRRIFLGGLSCQTLRAELGHSLERVRAGIEESNLPDPVKAALLGQVKTTEDELLKAVDQLGEAGVCAKAEEGTP